jgi:hypothetical protein
MLWNDCHKRFCLYATQVVDSFLPMLESHSLVGEDFSGVGLWGQAWFASRYFDAA